MIILFIHCMQYYSVMFNIISIMSTIDVLLCLYNMLCYIVYLTTLNCTRCTKVTSRQIFNNLLPITKRLQSMLLCQIIVIIWSIIVTKWLQSGGYFQTKGYKMVTILRGVITSKPHLINIPTILKKYITLFNKIFNIKITLFNTFNKFININKFPTFI